jgi:hypothetical protein
MSLKLKIACVALSMAMAGPVFAQNASPVCNHTKDVMAHTPTSAPGTDTNTSMAGTSSDAGNTSTGASSASIGTGPVDKTGVNNPCVAGDAGHGANGALPQTGPNTP